jgi:hypothetical protein
MRFDVFEIFSPHLFGARNKERLAPERRESLTRKATPSTESLLYLPPEEATTLERGLADPTNKAFRCLSRHARWATVHHLTHTTTIQ